jgi:hypothetical protein
MLKEFKTHINEKIKKPFLNLSFKDQWNLILTIASLLIALASLIIALTAITSVVKIKGFEDLLRATSENAIQLTKMDSTLFEQNRLQQINIGRNDSGLVELKKQTKTLIGLQKSNSDQLSIQRKVEKSNLIGDCQLLEGLYEKLMYMGISHENPFPIDKSYRKQTIKYLEDLDSLVIQGVNNNLLKMYENIYSQWVYFNSQIEFTIGDLNVSEENVLTKYFDVKVIVHELSPSPTIKPPTREESDIEQLKVLTEWTKRFWEKGVEPMMNIKEIQTYRHNNFSNYRRVTK